MAGSGPEGHISGKLAERMKPLDGTTLLERRWLLFILLALLWRGVYVEFKLCEAERNGTEGRWYMETPDTHSYFDPIDNVLNGGEYDPDYRMPGVGAPYFVFRMFLSRVASRDAMVVFQWFLSGISVYLLALIALRMSGSVRAAWATYVLFGFSTFSSWYDSSMSSDSLAASVIILQAFVFQQALDRKNMGLMALAGLFLTWVIFIRPVAALLMIPAVTLVFMHWGKSGSIRALVFFLLPFSVVESAWVARNWRVNHELNLLTNQGMMPDEIADRPLGYLMRFLQGYGGNYIWWEPGADIRWYGLWHAAADLDDAGRAAHPPPSYAYAPGYTPDSLRMVSELIRPAWEQRLSPGDSAAAIRKANATLERYTELHRVGAPFTHHVLSRFLMIRHMVIQNGTETLYCHPYWTQPPWMKLFKALQSAMYIYSFVVGCIVAFVSIRKWRRASSFLALWTPIVLLYMIFIYPLGLKMAEWRFMMHVFPFALLLATGAVMLWLERRYFTTK